MHTIAEMSRPRNTRMLLSLAAAVILVRDPTGRWAGDPLQPCPANPEAMHKRIWAGGNIKFAIIIL